MKPSERKVTFPIMGRKSSEIIRDYLESLDLNVIMPPKTTDETIRLGVKHCANMICYPLKTTLGNYIEALEKGANTLLAYDTKGICRFRQYNKLHEFTLTGLGYDFEMFVINPHNIVPQLRKLTGKSTITILRNAHKHYKRLKKHDEKSKLWFEDRPNIGIIGEIYVSNNEEINYGLEQKVRKFGANPYNTATTTDFMEDKIPLFNPFKIFKRDRLKKYKKQAQEFLNGPIGGHAFENLYNLLDLIDRGVDGIIHVLPLSCTAETTIEPYVDHICRNNKIPLLRIPIDENQAEANLETRIETFCEMIKWRGK